MRKPLCILLTVFTFTVGSVLGGYVAVWFLNFQFSKASEDVFLMATGLADTSREWNRSIYTDFDIPEALFTRDRAVVHYLLLSSYLNSDLEKEAFFRLGLAFISSECHLAKKYLRQSQQKGKPRPEVGRLLEELERSGCENAAQNLREGKPLAY